MDKLTSPVDVSVAVPSNSTPPQRRKRKSSKIALRVLGLLAALGLIAQLAYTFSGSSKWEYVSAKDGITVYSMKTPGRNLKKFKAVFTVHSTLSRFVMFAEDSKTDLGIGLYDVRDIDAPSDRVKWTSCKMPFPKPFKPRQMVTKTEFSQDPTSRVLTYRVTASPDKLPPDNCCYRVAVMNNVWNLTPVGHGDIRIEWVTDVDMGLPYPMANAAQVPGFYWMGPMIQHFLDRDQYKDAKYSWLREGEQ